MKETDRTKAICPFCGKERECIEVHEDGTDFYGHARGMVTNETIDNGCDCPLGKIAHNPYPIKKMCKNCKHRDGMYCKNKNVINNFNGLFTMPEKLEIKDITKKCDAWEVDTEIFKCLIQ